MNKFNIGDVVYFMVGVVSDFAIKKASVSEIRRWDKGIMYQVEEVDFIEDINDSYQIGEEILFKTVDELVDFYNGAVHKAVRDFKDGK